MAVTNVAKTKKKFCLSDLARTFHTSSETPVKYLMSTYCIHLYTYFVTDALVCAQCSGCLFPLIITHLFVFYVNTMCCTNFFTSSLSRPSVLQNHPSLVSFSAFPHQPQIYQLSMQISEECGEQAARTLNLPLRARSNFLLHSITVITV